MRRAVAVLAAVILIWGALPVQAQRGGPPPEALSACEGKKAGDACSFKESFGTMTGTCFVPPPGGLVCGPGGGGPRQGMQSGMQNRGGLNMGRGEMRGPMHGAMEGEGPSRPGAGFMGRGYRPNEPYAQAKQLGNGLTDTGQVTCFSTSGAKDCASAYPGQDAHYAGRPQAFDDKGDGTVFDPATGLLWQKGHNRKRLGYYAAKRTCEGLSLGGRTDWRLPAIKELFSITHWQGSTGRRPFLDGTVFDIEEPDASVLEGDRFASTHQTGMMGQTWSSTIYKGLHWDRPGVEAAFFFNFLDGRIKQAPTNGPMGLFYRCVAGPEWGKNQFADNGDGTVSDALTGLVWQQADDGQTRDWPGALAYCESLILAGQDDWRLPNVKELQSIVDYSRPEPAIDRRYLKIADPKGWFWSSTTHGENPDFANYVCFGKCISVDDVDVHGAGAQRSDPKTGNPNNWGSMGGQRDQVRIRNYARCVRG